MNTAKQERYRVHELARMTGMSSGIVIRTLLVDYKEHVKNASSTVSSPVARQFIQDHGPDGRAIPGIVVAHLDPSLPLKAPSILDGVLA
jgi:hypothetical protein